MYGLVAVVASSAADCSQGSNHEVQLDRVSLPVSECRVVPRRFTLVQILHEV